MVDTTATWLIATWPLLAADSALLLHLFQFYPRVQTKWRAVGATNHELVPTVNVWKTTVCTDCLRSCGGSCRNSAPPGQFDSSNPQSAEPEKQSLLTEPPSEPHPGQRVATSNPPQTPARETIPTLPGFNPLEPPSFYWGEVDATTLSLCIDKAYHQIVHWKPNLFKLPSGSSGALFVKSVASFLAAYAEGTALKSIALKAAMCMPALLLACPHNRSENADHVNLLKSRLNKWKT